MEKVKYMYIISMLIYILGNTWYFERQATADTYGFTIRYSLLALPTWIPLVFFIITLLMILRIKDYNGVPVKAMYLFAMAVYIVGNRWTYSVLASDGITKMLTYLQLIAMPSWLPLIAFIIPLVMIFYCSRK